MTVGNVPRQCHNYSKWFLAIGAYDTVYCQRVVPGETTRTCCQVGAHRKERETEERKGLCPLWIHKSVWPTEEQKTEWDDQRGEVEPPGDVSSGTEESVFSWQNEWCWICDETESGVISSSMLGLISCTRLNCQEILDSSIRREDDRTLYWLQRHKICCRKPNEENVWSGRFGRDDTN